MLNEKNSSATIGLRCRCAEAWPGFSHKRSFIFRFGVLKGCSMERAKGSEEGLSTENYGKGLRGLKRGLSPSAGNF